MDQYWKPLIIRKNRIIEVLRISDQFKCITKVILPPAAKMVELIFFGPKRNFGWCDSAQPTMDSAD